MYCFLCIVISSLFKLMNCHSGGSRLSMSRHLFCICRTFTVASCKWIVVVCCARERETGTRCEIPTAVHIPQRFQSNWWVADVLLEICLLWWWFCFQTSLESWLKWREQYLVQPENCTQKMRKLQQIYYRKCGFKSGKLCHNCVCVFWYKIYHVLSC